MTVPASPPSLDIVFTALADPTRRAILTMLLEDDMAVTDVAEPFEMSLGGRVEAPGILAGAGLISQEKRGPGEMVQAGTGRAARASVWMQAFRPV